MPFKERYQLQAKYPDQEAAAYRRQRDTSLEKAKQVFGSSSKKEQAKAMMDQAVALGEQDLKKSRDLARKAELLAKH